MGRREQIEANKKRKQELSDQLAISREAVGMSRDLLKESTNVKRKLINKVQNNQAKVAIGSAVFGLVASTLLRRKKRNKQEHPKRGVVGWVGSLITGLVVRKVKAAALNKSKDMLVQQIQRRQQL